jgi:hypothetical protein
MRFPVRAVSMMVAASLSAGAAFAQKGETVKVAWIDPLSGLMARWVRTSSRATSSWPSTSTPATRPA